jgi:hypothetical protein
MVAQSNRPAPTGIVVNPVSRKDVPLFGNFRPERRRAIADLEVSRRDDEVRRIRATLEQIDACGELRDFAGPPQEKRALIAFARSHGLVVWRKTRHELTPAGRRWLISHGGVVRARRGKLPVRLVAALVGGGALAGAWFSADAAHQIFSPPSRGATAPLVSRHAAVEPDAMLARSGIEPMKSRPSAFPLSLIRSDAPVFSAAIPAEGGEVPPPATEESSKTSAQETKKVKRPAHRPSSVSRQRHYEDGSAMAFSETYRPVRRSADYPRWGFQYPGWNGWR